MLLIRLVANGMDRAEIIEFYPYTEDEDIHQALQYAAWLAEENVDTAAALYSEPLVARPGYKRRHRLTHQSFRYECNSLLEWIVEEDGAVSFYNEAGSIDASSLAPSFPDRLPDPA